MVDIKFYERQRETYQNDYQFRASAVVAEAVYRKGMGLEPGPRYISMPVGCGKTTGAIWGVVRFAKENPDKKICFLTPYVQGVKEQFAKLKTALGESKVGRFYSGASGEKLKQLEKQVFVCTHQFGSHNLAKLQDRDLVVVDEAFYGSDDVQITSDVIYRASEWARQQDILFKEFRSVFQLTDAIVQKSRVEDGFTPIDCSSVMPELKAISGYDFSGLMNQFRDVDRIGDFQRFCSAMLQGKAFAVHKKNGEVFFASGALGIPSIENVVVLTATGGMTYKSVGVFSEIPLLKDNFVYPSYGGLTLVRLSDPEISGSYKTWKSAKTKPRVVSYVEWVLEQVTEDEIYFCVPKSVFDGCLLEFFGFGRTAKIDLPATVKKYGKTIHVSHHHVGIGSNNYKDCKAVVYLWDSHIPSFASVRKYYVLSGEEVTSLSLTKANNGNLRGPFAEVRDAALAENVIQQIGRGTIRQIGSDGQGGEMKAYVLLEPKTFSRLQLQMGGCKVVECNGYGKLRRPSGRVQKVLEYLHEISERDLTKSEVEEATGTNINRIGGELENMKDELSKIGYSFEKGRRGRGNGAKFMWIGGSEDGGYTKLEKAA